jgi:hypothetical protein
LTHFVSTQPSIVPHGAVGDGGGGGAGGGGDGGGEPGGGEPGGRSTCVCTLTALLSVLAQTASCASRFEFLTVAGLPSRMNSASTRASELSASDSERAPPLVVM